jgi:hypothetical protein
MLRIVNMQRRLRPVYPGFGAIDFARDLRDLVCADTPAAGRSTQIAENFEIQLQIAFNRAMAIFQFLPAGLMRKTSWARVPPCLAEPSPYCRTVLENMGLQSVSRL